MPTCPNPHVFVAHGKRFYCSGREVTTPGNPSQKSGAQRGSQMDLLHFETYPICFRASIDYVYRYTYTLPPMNMEPDRRGLEDQFPLQGPGPEHEVPCQPVGGYTNMYNIYVCISTCIWGASLFLPNPLDQFLAAHNYLLGRIDFGRRDPGLLVEDRLRLPTETSLHNRKVNSF